MRLNLAGRRILVIFPLNLAGGVFSLCWWQWMTEGSWDSLYLRLLAAGSPPLFGHPKVVGCSQTSGSTINTVEGQPCPKAMGLETLERALGSPPQHGDTQIVTLWCHPIPAAAPSLLPQVPGPGAPGRHSRAALPGTPEPPSPAAPAASQRLWLNRDQKC